MLIIDSAKQENLIYLQNTVYFKIIPHNLLTFIRIYVIMLQVGSFSHR